MLQMLNMMRGMRESVIWDQSSIDRLLVQADFDQKRVIPLDTSSQELQAVESQHKADLNQCVALSLKVLCLTLSVTLCWFLSASLSISASTTKVAGLHIVSSTCTTFLCVCLV